MAAENVSQLDALIGAVTQVFVLSLAVERVSTLLKHMKLGFWGSSGRRALIAKESKTEVDPDTRRTVNSVNTLFIGMGLALCTQSNAFGGLAGASASGWHAVAQILMTGAAAGVGSSFWYDLISLLIQVRETRKEVGAVAAASADQITLAAKGGPAGLTRMIKEGDRSQPTV